jgi:predicted O-methyltransferase YrrM
MPAVRIHESPHPRRSSMFPFWNACLEPLLRALEPESIVEIGSEEGWTTERILEYCRAAGARCRVIDPQPIGRPEVAALLSESGVHHQGLSLDLLPTLPDADLYLVDGDHNWYTVYHELRAIVAPRAASGRPLPVIVLHDVGWPYGRRDMYYDPENVPAEHRQPHARTGMRRGRSELGGAFNDAYHNARHEGGARNGVLTAVEDFLRDYPGLYHFRSVPGFHGLGLLRPARGLSPAVGRRLDSIFRVPPRLRALMEELERQRVDALVRLAESRAMAAS